MWTNGVPNGNFNAFIDGGNPVVSTVSLDISASLNNLTISKGDTLGINNNQALTVNGASIVNAGQLQLNSGGNLTELLIGGANVTLSGAGTLTLSNNPVNYIFGTAGGNILTNQQTIQGAGVIGNGQLTLVNAGIINANVSNQLLVNPSGGTTNTGTLQATAGATLNLQNAVTNTGGLILADGSGSQVALNNATVTGGTLNTTNGGVITASNTTLGGFTNAGTLQVPNNQAATLNGNVVNTGSIQLNSIGNLTELLVGAPSVTLSGSGTVTLSNTTVNYIFGSAGTNVLNNQQTIQGAGVIGNNQLTLVNGGTINANVSNQLVVDPSGGTANTGTLEATAGGTLNLSGGAIANAGGKILAGTGSAVLLSASTVTGGTLGTTGTGVIQSFGGTLNGVSNTGTLQVLNNNSTTLIGTINNSGSIQLNSIGNVTVLAASGAVTLTGGGAVTLSDNNQNYLSGTAADSFINQNNTISGSGNIGNNAVTFTNHGVVDAVSAAGNTLTIQAGAGGTINTATMEASSGGTLNVLNTVNNAGGVIQALAGTGTAAGGTVTFTGSTVTGGTVQALGTGVNAGTVLVPNATFNTLTTAGTIQVPNNTTLNLGGTLTNTGTVMLESAGNTTELFANGAVTLTGKGAVTLSDQTNNFIFGSTGSSLLNLDNTISGAGNIGNGVTAFTNDATVDAVSSHGNHLVLNSGTAGIVNAGLMEASSGGTLEIDSTLTNFSGSSTGTLKALAGGVVELKGATIKGGILSTVGSGVFSSAGSTLDALTLAGKLQVPNNQATNLEGVINDNGSISLLSRGNITKLKIAGTSVTLQGTGKVVLSDNVQNYILGATTGKEQLINTITIEGAGNVGNAALTLTNQGSILATSALGNHLIIDPGTGGAANTGTMAATGTATLELANAINNTGGVISASAVGSTVQLDSNAVVTGGTLGGPGTFVSFNGTISGLTNAGTLQIPNNTTLTTIGTITNTGTIQVNSGGNTTELVASGAVTLTGSGKVTFSDNGNNYITGAAGSSLVNQNNTISGSGNIGNGITAFTNQGVVDAMSVASHLVIEAGGAGALNTGTMEASSGGTLELQRTVNNTGGTITALAGTGTAAGGTVLINGATVTGGTINSLGTGGNAGAVVSTGGTLNNLTNASALQVPNNTTTTLQGNIVNTGTIAVNSGGNNTFLTISGNVTLSGSGAVILSNTTPNYIQGASTGAEVLTNASTIEGSGNIGDGFLGLSNKGLIFANQSTPLVINASAGFTNTGTLEAAAGSLLNITGPFSNFSGTTLTGGKYLVAGTLEFTGANIVTNAASITLTGPAAQIVNQNNASALASFTTNAAAGKFTLAGQSLTTGAGSFTNAGAVSIGVGSTFTVGNGGVQTLATNYTQTSGVTTVDGTLTSSPSTAGTPTLNLTSGALFGQGTVIDAVKSSGIVVPGDSLASTGKLGVTGAYTQAAAGSLDISIAGTAPGTKYDQLNVTGAATLSGTLNLKSLNGFVPAVGTTFDILNATNLLGTFTTVTGTSINATEHYVVSYNGTEVLVTVASGAAVTKPGSGLMTLTSHKQQVHGIASLGAGAHSKFPAVRPVETLRSMAGNAAPLWTAPVGAAAANRAALGNVSRANFGAAPFGTTGYRKVLDYHLEVGTLLHAVHAHSLMGTLRDLGSQYNNLGYVTYR